MNYSHEFIVNVYSTLCFDDVDKSRKLNSNILRQHRDNLAKNGDFSFPLEECIWKRAITIDEINNLLKVSQAWKMPIAKFELVKRRCHLYLDRVRIFREVLVAIDGNSIDYGKNDNAMPESVIVEDSSPMDFNVTDYRLQLIQNTILNLMRYGKPIIDSPNERSYKVHLTINSASESNDSDDDVTLVCGIVYDPADAIESRKKSKMIAMDYVKKRSIDMQLLAQHKYGVRVQNEKAFIDLIERLGHAASIVDLMEVKHTSPVGLVTIDGQSSSKGAAFILYNSARMETLFRTFHERVATRTYPELPNINEIDFDLLKEEEEWLLLLNFVIDFPNLIKNSIENIATGKVYLHNICNFLTHLASAFSVYYRRVRILTENREKLLPTMQARLTLIKCLRLVLNKTLKLLDIDPVMQM